MQIVPPESSYMPREAVLGTSGNIYWSMPHQEQANKQVLIALADYTSGAPIQITFPMSFEHVASVIANTTGLTIESQDLTQITLPASTDESGVIIIQGM